MKLANIELEPGKERYDGGSWHVEGQLNEKIRASAIYYYDECNVSPSRLAFRQTSDGLQTYEQNDDEGLDAIFGMTRNTVRIQMLGSVLTREDRIVAFANNLQHRVSPFELIDKTRRGWRKILAFFLIDPELPIISTATVPPQRTDWWAAQVRLVKPFAGLPTEIFDQIMSVRHLSDNSCGIEERQWLTPLGTAPCFSNQSRERKGGTTRTDGGTLGKVRLRPSSASS